MGLTSSQLYRRLDRPAFQLSMYNDDIGLFYSCWDVGLSSRSPERKSIA
jgi:hypothetical protein